LTNELAITISPEIEAINDVIRKIQPEEIRKLLGAAQAFINSQQFIECWNHDAVYQKIAKIFNESMGRT
jgi:hypothetical protein